MFRVKRSFDKMIEVATYHNYLLIKYWTENNKTKVDVICSKGHLTTKFAHVLHKGCLQCKIPHNKLTQLQIVNRLEEKGFKLTGDFINWNTPIDVVCKQGHRVKTWFGKPGCMQCMAINNSYKLNEIQEIFAKENYKLVLNGINEKDLGSKPSQRSFKYICPLGHEGQTDVRNFLEGKRCRKCWAKNNRQEKHYNWNPELTDKDRLTRRHFPEIREWRTVVFERDDYTCQACKQLSNKLVAHHLNGWDKHPDQRFDINNGVALCQNCHKQFHLIYRNRRNTKNQYVEWLQSLTIGKTRPVVS